MVLRVRFEVISPGTRTVIASGAWPDVPSEVGWSGYPPVMWFIAGTDLSARYLEDAESGVPVPRSMNSCCRSRPDLKYRHRAGGSGRSGGSEFGSIIQPRREALGPAGERPIDSS